MKSYKYEFKKDVKWYNAFRALHKRDGPAINWSNGHKEWHINNIRISKKKFNLWTLRARSIFCYFIKVVNHENRI